MNDVEGTYKDGANKSHEGSGNNLLYLSNLDCDDLSEMAWTCRKHSNNLVNKAGDTLSGRIVLSGIDNNSALDVAGNWRSSHGYPLHYMWRELTRRARKMEPECLIAKRIKRIPSIIAKLKRFDGMKLSRMQDLGGCRAILTSADAVDKLVDTYEKRPPSAATFCDKDDYIASPKSDGYRSVHLVYKYQGNSQNGAFKGLQIEVQVRSVYQHAWASAVETIDAFIGQGLKSGRGDKSWSRFFVIVSAIIAMFEKRPLPPMTSDSPEMFSELELLCGKLNVPNVFLGLATGVGMIEEKAAKQTKAYILELDSKKQMTFLHGFGSPMAADLRLLEMEKMNADKPFIQVVLAYADSVTALREAYPTYYADTHIFITMMDALLGIKRESKKADGDTKSKVS